jgi:hypothetical protein
MDLIDLIEGTRFLGRELLVWLWLESEVLEGHVEAPGFGKVPFWLESRITLETPEEKPEQSALRGALPSSRPEAREAVRQGKLPTMARLRLELGEAAYSLTLKADTLALASVGIPAVLKDSDDRDERFYERIGLVEELEAVMDALYAQFLGIRLSPAWEAAAVPAIRAWATGDRKTAESCYRRATKGAVPVGGRRGTRGAVDEAKPRRARGAREPAE